MEFARKNAIYLQIADYICAHILAGAWKQGERIPSVRDLAASMEVNPNTVMRTYTVLQEKGIIMNQRGIGFFVAADGRSRTRDIRKEAFVKDDAPAFFQTMDLLGLGFERLKELYDGRTREPRAGKEGQ